MKKRILTLSVIASVLTSLPAHSGFTIIQKAAPDPNPPVAAQHSSYSLIESDTPLIPVPPTVESVRPPVVAPIRNYSAPALRDEQPLLSVERLEAESQRIQSQIDRLRADLDAVKVALASARTRSGNGTHNINRNLDVIEKQIADASTSAMRVKFDLNSTKFTPDATTASQLLRTAQTSTKITIYGHADNTGTPAQNSIVAMARAVSARNYLILKGIQSSRISVVSRGATEPIADNSTADGRARNRRVEVEFSSKPAFASTSIH